MGDVYNTQDYSYEFYVVTEVIFNLGETFFKILNGIVTRELFNNDCKDCQSLGGDAIISKTLTRRRNLNLEVANNENTLKEIT